MSTGFRPAARTSTTALPSLACGSSKSPTSGGAPYHFRIAARIGRLLPPVRGQFHDRRVDEVYSWIRPRSRLPSARMDSAQLAELDRQVLWHPFTQQQGWTADDEVLMIERGDRCTLYDTDG